MSCARGLILVLPEPGHDRSLYPRALGQLVPIANRPLLHHAIAALRDAGVREVAVLAGPAVAAAVRAALPSGAAWQVELEHIEVAAGSADLAALRQASAFIGDASVIVHRGEALLADELPAELAAFLGGTADAAVLDRPGNSPADELARRRARRRSVAQLSLGVDLLSPKALAGLGQLADGDGKDLVLEEALAHLAQLGLLVQRREIAGGWALGEGVDDLLEGNRLALDRTDSSWDPAVLRHSRIEGRVVVDPSARIEDSLVRGPSVIGPGVVLRHAYVGPYTSVAPGVLIENAEIEHSMILEDVSIAHIPWRLERSIIGARTRITHEFRVPQTVALLVGEDSRITVS
jgi:glucose-1-phosphate thymidylyltransferase